MENIKDALGYEDNTLTVEFRYGELLTKYNIISSKFNQKWEK